MGSDERFSLESGMTNDPRQWDGKRRASSVVYPAGVAAKRLRPGRCARCGAVAVWSVSAHVFAAPAQPILLTYEAPPECPNGERVLELATRLLRHRPSASIVADAKITRQGSAYLLDLQVDGGRRRIASDACDSLVQTLSVIISLAVEPRARNHDSKTQEPQKSTAESANEMAATSAATNVVESPAPQPTAGRPETSAPLVAQAPHVDASRRPAAPRPTPSTTSNRQKPPSAPAAARKPTEAEPTQPPAKLELHPALLLWTESGMLPHLAQGPNLGLWLDYDVWSLAATAEWLLPQWAPMPGGNERGGYLSFLGGQLDVCRQLLQPPRLVACLGVESGDMMGKGAGVANGKLGHGVWLAVTTELAMRVRIWTWMSADLRLGLALPVKRPAFGFDDYSWKFVPEAWSMRVASGFSWF